ncbi:hypothetical protein GW17_00043711 [Ensete ventricosum]|uniref:Uncharacterized protein n=1 Tax=Ensete ventricosum TaxID=4639 RepID=A0A444D6T1_ENSVE|nr:hypothetical protein GW17_00043711 [Ensete ventricosum]RZR72294.1 hypothetical protein BHM03_00012002 [Ensete ventricosum]
MPAPLSDSVPYILMSVFPKRLRVLVALHTAQLGPPRLHAKCFCWEPQREHHMRRSYIPVFPDPYEEDKGGQASSLVVSTRWISAAKLLQSDLATLAQREGGE